MAEYHFKLTVRDTSEGIEVKVTGSLGDCDNKASVIATALCDALQQESERIRAEVEGMTRNQPHLRTTH